MKIKTVSIDSDVEEVLRNSNLDGNKLTLSGQLDRSMYQKVNKILELIGFKWDKKYKCHVGQGDSADKLREALEGGKVINEKQTYQFFATPEALAEAMVSSADITPKDIVLEPSAGTGSIVKAIHRSVRGINVFVCELEPKMRKELEGQPNVTVIGEDFMLLKDRSFTKIVMNPPFTSGQDIEHVRHAYDLLAPGGRLVAITSQTWVLNDNKKSRDFRAWLDGFIKDGNATRTFLGEGVFKESGTNVGTTMLIICKPIK